MKVLLLFAIILCSCLAIGASGGDYYQYVPLFPIPPEDQDTIGDGHGDIAVSASGDIYVSVQGGKRPGLQVYGPDGQYKKNLEGVATDLHGFRIHQDKNGVEYLYATELDGERLVKYTLSGELILIIPVDKVVPTAMQGGNFFSKRVRLTGVAVASDGTIFVTDGYGTSLIHKFDPNGQYQGSIAGKGAPYNFTTAHKVIVDRRFSPERLLVTDRENNRLVWLDFNGNIIAERGDLRLPSALAIQGDLLAVAELGGRVSVLRSDGSLVAALGTNDNREQTATPKVPPSNWTNGIFTSPHGIAFDNNGNILVTEWNEWGRVLKFNHKAI